MNKSLSQFIFAAALLLTTGVAAPFIFGINTAHAALVIGGQQAQDYPENKARMYTTATVMTEAAGNLREFSIHGADAHFFASSIVTKVLLAV